MKGSGEISSFFLLFLLDILLKMCIYCIAKIKKQHKPKKNKIMEILIFISMLILISLCLAKKNGENNYFSLLCVTVVISLVWGFAQSWAWKVVAMYITIISIGFVRVYKADSIGRNPIWSTLTLMYQKRLIRRDPDDVSMNRHEKIQRWSKIVGNLRMVFSFILFCLLLIFSVNLVIEVWWKWVIVAPASLSCLGIIILLTKDYLDKL